MTEQQFTASSEDGAETRVIAHTNGDRTIVPGDVTDEQAAELAQLTGPDIAAAVERYKAEKHAAEQEKEQQEATQAVLADPPAAGLASTAPAAGPDPVTQGGASAPVLSVPFQPGTVPDAETTKASEAADPSGGAESTDGEHS